ncbi:precorrin-6A synthase (deacetylating) [Kaistia algarum]|uniref:precorrin-6A synthase (deacetylating) n=1 Tax=Kaistia algarum TaxID=2083279 RepID=UPI000CE83C57|nr:precorrin-6A synthase (deacetylating) [Kaistia algarum]MCX5513722.1 precorrin-6A synthase (deacetylating) [Kaistia algarum]PPE79406.1 precorrin-6A synthase (deacetylating) [Kaistia algarum]
MRKILVIGIGAGNPDFLTVQAIEAMNRADVFFLPDKGSEKAELRQLRLDMLARFRRGDSHRFVDIVMPKRAKSEDYRGNVDTWHAAIASAYGEAITAALAEGETGALLVWGDPALYDSSLRILERIEAGGLDLEVEVIPGISSIQALAARHRIALNRIGEPVLLTTGRRLAEAIPDEDCVVLLDGEATFTRPGIEDRDLFWGAYLGTPDEVVISGRAGDVAASIAELRARLRAEKGWIMDAYLLRRAKDNGSG